MRKAGSVHLLLCLLWLLVPVSGASAAPPPGDKPLVDVQVNPGALVWQARRQNVSDWTLRVTAPGGAVLDLTSRGAAPVLTFQDLRDAFGGEVPEGPYTYEISAALEVDAATRGEIESARAQGAKPAWLLEAARDLRQSGNFRVVNDRFVYDEDEVEPGTTEDEGSEAAEDTARRFPVGELTPLTTNEAPGTDRQVVIDDLVVRDSACVGADCPFSPAFGTDTIRLQEENLRIKFDDSTASGSTFPDRDWEILANDPNSGGLDRFSIHDVTSANVPFTIEGDGPSNSLYLHSQGRIGLGTATPTQQLHLVDGDTPTVRIEQDSTQSFPPQAWDVGGNEDEFFVRDVNNGLALPLRIEAGAPRESLFIADNGDVGMGTDIPDSSLHVFGGTAVPHVLVEANNSTVVNETLLVLESNGGIRLDLIDNEGTFTDTSDDIIWFMQNNGGVSGDTSFILSKQGTGGAEIKVFDRLDAQSGHPTLLVSGTTEAQGLRAAGSGGSARVEVLESAATTADRLLAEFRNNGPVRLRLQDTSTEIWDFVTSNQSIFLGVPGNPVTEFRLTASGDLIIGGTLTQNSNRHTKTAIRSIDAGSVLRKVLALPIATWQRRGNEGVTHLGPMAQDFRALFGLGRDETSISPIDLAGVALAAVQGLHQDNQDLRAENQALRRAWTEVQNRLDELEARLPAP